MGHSPSQV